MKNIIITFLLTLIISFILISKVIEKQYFNKDQIGYTCSLILIPESQYETTDCEKIIYLLETN